jgi:pimeloyl-ACP methyl ester carboxylesterase
MGRNYRLSIHAREPLYDDFARIKSIPIYVAYGDDDWLSYDKVSDDIKALQDSGVNISLTTIKNAGHHLYLDNTQMFHDTINEWLEK